MQVGWSGWRHVVICDRNIAVREKWKIYKTVVRPATMCGLALTKIQ